MLQVQTIQSLEQAAPYLFVPKNEAECDQLIRLLDNLIDIVRDDETHPLANMMDVLGVLIETYETETIPEPPPDPVAVLQFLMEEHNLKQKDFPELGSQGVVSEILNGKRTLNLRQIKALSTRFRIPAAAFV
ncbi:MAG: transcriptional regulator [Anaerolineae bacterium]|nr:transcriptional regulator [Anaerolineae bacterium]